LASPIDTSRLISLISLIRTWNRPFEILQLVLTTLDFVLELGERRRIALLRLDVLVEPTGAGLVLRESRNEILARHPGLLDAKEHDFLLEQAHFGDVLAQIVDQLIEHLRESFSSISSPQIFLRIFCVFGSFDPSLSSVQELVMKPSQSN
jgi:hypothetical protein